MLKNGQILDVKYEVIRTLGEGGMAIVYLCRNTRLNNLWAVKEIKAHWKGSIDFLAEPNLLKDLNHPGIPRIIDIFNENDTLYMVEDYIEGITLKQYVEQKGPLELDTVIQFSLQLCSILEYLHGLNPPIIYRDLKPSNVMITNDNKVILVDFGIARTFKPNQDSDTQVLGSVGYIAPEQLMNLQSNEQTDIYSLGATIFFMCTGRAPVSTEEISDPNSYELRYYNSIVDVIQKSAANSQSLRYKTVKAVIGDLDKLKTSFTDGTVIADINSDTVMFDKTLVMQQNEPKVAVKKTRRNKYIILAVLACILVLALLLLFNLVNKSKKNALANEVPKVSIPEVKKETQPPKDTTEKDVVTRGVLYKDSPVIPSTSSSKGKGKKKEDEKPLQFIFNLNPFATLSNSKMNIALKIIEISEGKVIATVDIENKTAAPIKMDLTKTFLVNGANTAFISNYKELGGFISVPANSKTQNLRVSFQNFSFEGSSIILKTSVLMSSSKDVNLFIDIKKTSH